MSCSCSVALQATRLSQRMERNLSARRKLPQNGNNGLKSCTPCLLMHSNGIPSLSLSKQSSSSAKKSIKHVRQLVAAYLKGARDLCRSLDHMKKQCVVGSTQRQNRCLL